MPAAAVIPALVACSDVVAVKTLTVDLPSAELIRGSGGCVVFDWAAALVSALVFGPTSGSRCCGSVRAEMVVQGVTTRIGFNLCAHHDTGSIGTG